MRMTIIAASCRAITRNWTLFSSGRANEADFTELNWEVYRQTGKGV